jgi:hypothetical protein
VFVTQKQQHKQLAQQHKQLAQQHKQLAQQHKQLGQLQKQLTAVGGGGLAGLQSTSSEGSLGARGSWPGTWSPVRRCLHRPALTLTCTTWRSGLPGEPPVAVSGSREGGRTPSAAASQPSSASRKACPSGASRGSDGPPFA